MTPSPDPNSAAADPPLGPRSVLLSTLLGVRPPRLRRSHLLAMAELFGVDEAAADAALAELLAAGDVTLENGRYRLGTRLTRRQRHQEQVRTDPRQRWNGRWSLAVVDPTVEEAEADEVRRALAGLAYARWREGVWLRPDNLGLRYATVLQRTCTVWTSEAPSGLDGRVLAARLWDLDGWADRARTLLDRLAEPLDTDGRFLVAVRTQHHLLRDPLLPDGLFPAGWPAQPLRIAYDRFATDLETELASFLRG
jgi:phenylacetic acid degradation operon negative regulatory protein